jgi:hypothetical protein
MTALSYQTSSLEAPGDIADATLDDVSLMGPVQFADLIGHVP